MREVLKKQKFRNPTGREAVECFYALCDAMDLLRLCCTPDVVTADQLHTALIKHLRKYKSCYGLSSWFPKCHLATHLATMLHEFGRLIACFVHERKHKEIKRFGAWSRAVAKDTTNSMWDSGVLKTVIRAQLKDLNEGALPSVAVHSTSFKPAPSVLKQSLQNLCGYVCDEIFVSVECVLRRYIHVHTNDVVCVQFNGHRHIAEVWYLICYDNTYRACVSLWQRLPAHNMFLVQDSPHLISTTCIVDTLTYRRVGETVSVVPKPGLSF